MPSYCAPARADFIFYAYLYVVLLLAIIPLKDQSKNIYASNMMQKPAYHIWRSCLPTKMRLVYTGFKSNSLACSHTTFHRTRKNIFPFLILKTHCCFPTVHEKWTDILAEQSIVNPKCQSWVLTGSVAYSSVLKLRLHILICMVYVCPY